MDGSPDTVHGAEQNDSSSPAIRPGPAATFLHADAGSTLIEYAIAAAIISIGAIAAMQTLGCQLSAVYNGLGNALTNAL